MKKILLLNGNPKRTSFCAELSDVYAQAAQTRADICRFDLATMDFNPSLEAGYAAEQALEPCLAAFSEALLAAEHIVIVAPIWWGGLPARLKGLIDRVFLPGVTFRFDEGNPAPVPLLAGKSARIVLTMDMPGEFATEQAAPVLAQLGGYTLEFCGVSTPATTLFGSVLFSDAGQREAWKETVRALGAQGL